MRPKLNSIGWVSGKAIAFLIMGPRWLLAFGPSFSTTLTPSYHLETWTPHLEVEQPSCDREDEKKNHTGDSLARVWKNLESSRTSLNSCESLGLPSSGLIVGYKNQSPVWLIYWIGFCYMQLNAILKTTSWHRLSEFWWSNWMASSVPTQPRALGLHWTKNDAWGMHNCDGILFFLGFKILKDPQYLNMARIPGLSPPEHPPFLEEANFGEHPQLVDVNLGEICQTVVCV